MNQNQKKWLSITTLFMLACAIRIFKLNMGFWRDEVVTLTEFVPLPWLEIIKTVPYPNNHLFYTLLCKLSILTFGEKEWSARLPAMIFGALTPPTLYLVLRKRFSQLVSFGAGLFLAIHYWAVWFSQDARGYSGLIFLSLLSTWLFLEFIEQAQWKQAFAYVLTAGISVYFHLYGLFIIFGQFLWLFILCLRRRAKIRLLLLPLGAVFLGGIIYLPAADQLYQYAITYGTHIKNRELDLIFLKKFLLSLTGSFNGRISLLLGLSALPGFYLAIKKCPSGIAIYLLSAFLVLISTGLARVFIYPRFLSYLLPIFSLSLAQSLELIVQKTSALFKSPFFSFLLTFFLASIFCFCLISGLITYFQTGKSEAKKVAEYLKATYPNRELVILGSVSLSFSYYYPNLKKLSGQEPISSEELKGKLVGIFGAKPDDPRVKIIAQSCRYETSFIGSEFRTNFFSFFICEP